MTMPDARELRDFLKANATVVAPGETLVIRANDLTAMQIHEVSRSLNGTDPDGTPWLPFLTVVVPGDGFAVVKPSDISDALRDIVHDEVRAEFARQENRGLFS